ncbi:MAG: hypothetical protein MJ070_00475 [Lachnospiraceae bacterium]|nr:hypothetical protein [Lachnospiraceae bacterium]
MKKKLFAAILAAATLLSVFISCAGPKDPAKDTSSTDPSATGPEATEPVTEATLNVPEELDYEGRTFTVLSCPGQNQTVKIYHTHFDVEEQNADDLNDGVYVANSRTEEYLNIEFATDTSGALTDTKVYRQHIAADDDAFDYAIWIDRFGLALAEDGMVYSVNDLSDYYVDLSNPWWYESLNHYLSIDGKFYLASGYSDLSLFGNMSTMLFNKTIAADLQLGSLYQMVYDGTWTFDEFYTMERAAAKDVNGDQVMDDEDQWGAVYIDTHWYNPFAAANGVYIIDKDDFDLPYFAAFDGEELYEIYDRVLADFSDPDIAIPIRASKVYTQGHVYENTTRMFADDKALFTGITPFYFYLLREKADYGILPFPKVEAVEAGTPYYSFIPGIHAHFAPSTTKDPEFTSAVMEVSNYYYYRYAIPNYVDVVLAYKQVRDDDSAYMLDMAIKYRRMELGQTYWWDACIGNTAGKLWTEPNAGKFVSLFTANRSMIEDALDRSVALFEGLE